MKIALIAFILLSVVAAQNTTYILGAYKVISQCNINLCPLTSWNIFGRTQNFTCPVVDNYGARIFQDSGLNVILNISAQNRGLYNSSVSLALPAQLWTYGNASVVLNNNDILGFYRCDNNQVSNFATCQTYNKYNTYFVTKFQYNPQYKNWTQQGSCNFYLTRTGNMETVPSTTTSDMHPELFVGESLFAQPKGHYESYSHLTMPDPTLSSPKATTTSQPDPRLSTPTNMEVPTAGMPDPRLATPTRMEVPTAGMPDPRLTTPTKIVGKSTTGMPDPTTSVPTTFTTRMPDPTTSVPTTSTTGMPDPTTSVPTTSTTGMPDPTTSVPTTSTTGMPDPTTSVPTTSTKYQGKRHTSL